MHGLATEFFFLYISSVFTGIMESLTNLHKSRFSYWREKPEIRKKKEWDFSTIRGRTLSSSVIGFLIFFILEKLLTSLKNDICR